MYKFICVFILFLFSHFSFSQSTHIDNLIAKISIEQDTVLSVYNWITDNIKYDVAKMKKIEERGRSRNQSKYKSEEDYNNAMLIKIIKDKKGVCEDYALLFSKVMTRLGYQSFVVEGYTKNKKGKVSKSIGHAWNALNINGQWKLYDLTWGAGYVENEKKFVKRYSKEWYETDPSEMLKTHMPYDPIWQLTNSPVDYKTFEESHQMTSELKQDYEKLIDLFFESNGKDKLQTQVDRSKALGKSIKLVGRWRKYLIKKIGMYGITDNYDLLNKTQENMVTTVNSFNDYIKSRNKNLKSKKWTPESATLILESIKEDAESIMDIFGSVDVDNKKAKSQMNSAKRNCEKFIKQVEKEISYLGTLR